MTYTMIQVENVAKRYRIGVKEERPDTLFQAIIGAVTAPIKNLRQLRNLSSFVSMKLRVMI
ncbi:MAG: hypothetical protein HC837_03855 [Chloroflexaceae bacterium]|nr:hypothetical protein [Chloroflexaceae bacterium]